MTTFGPHWHSAVEPPPADELLVLLADQLHVTLTTEQARGLLALTDGHVADAARLLGRMIAAYARRQEEGKS